MRQSRAVVFPLLSLLLATGSAVAAPGAAPASGTASHAEASGPGVMLRNRFPPEIAALAPGRTTRAELREKFGEPASTELPMLYYELEGIRFALSVELDASGTKLASFTYRFPKPPCTAGELAKFKPSRVTTGPRETELAFDRDRMVVTHDNGGSQPVRSAHIY